MLKPVPASMPPHDASPDDALRDIGPLRDGRRLSVRELRPDDGDAARTVNRELSAHSSYLRYFGQVACAGDHEVRRVLAPGRDRLSLLALVDGRPVALAEVDGLDAPEGCETAMAVDDEFQGYGIGTLLLAEVIRCAALRGQKSVRADVLSDNRVMLDVLQRSGYAATFTSDRDARHVLLRVTGADRTLDSYPPPQPAGR